MTRNRVLMCLCSAAAVAALAAAPLVTVGAAPTVQIKSISSRAGTTGSSLIIEASEPVPYVATQPDPLTLLLDLRNVGFTGVANRVPVSTSALIAGVELEEAESMGASVSRVRVLLTRATGHRVRSDRNTIVVDFDRATGPNVYASSTAAPNAMQALAPPKAPALDAIMAVAQPTSSTRPTGPTYSPAGRVQGALQQTPQQASQQTQPRRYTGALSNWNIEDADVRGFLRLIQDISGLNMVIDSSITGRVNLVLNQVPWDQALDVVLKQHKLGAVVEDTIVRIAPLTTLAEEQEQLRKLAEQQALSGNLQVSMKALSYAKAADLRPILVKLLSSRGTMEVDARTNTLIITDLPERLENLSSILGTLDRAEPQVEIEARIVRTTSNIAKALGIQWGFLGQASPYLGNTTGLAFPNNGVLNGRAPGGAPNTAVNLPAAGATSGVGLALGSINGAFSLDATLTALETEGQVKLLSTPRISTLNNVEAEVAQGVQVPFQTTANNTTTTQWKDAALTLRVKPQITEAGTVLMQIAVDKGSLGAVTINGQGINTQRANTTVLVNDGETTVIGGIYEGQESNTKNGVPGLSKIPIFKWLFMTEDKREQNDELLIFITPRITRR